MKATQLLFELSQDVDGRERFGVFGPHVGVHDRDGDDVHGVGGLSRVHLAATGRTWGSVSQGPGKPASG